MGEVIRSIVRRDVPQGPWALPDGLSPVLSRIYAAREVTHAAQLDYSLQGLHPYTELSGMERAVDLLVEAVDRRV